MSYRFVASKTAQYKQIGNAVPPEVGKALGLAITAYLEEGKKSSGASARRNACEVSMKLLWSFINSPSMEHLESVPYSEFIQVWMAIHRVKPTVHPDNAFDESGPLKYPSYGQSLLIEPYYLRTGWPYVLIPIAREAATRYKSGKISASQYYFQLTEQSGIKV